MLRDATGGSRRRGAPLPGDRHRGARPHGVVRGGVRTPDDHARSAPAAPQHARGDRVGRSWPSSSRPWRRSCSSAGILFRSVRDRRGFWLGALVSGLIFGLAHYQAAAWQDTVLLQSIMVFTGVALAYIYERRGNLLANVAAHMVFNVVGVVPDPVGPLSSTFRILRATVRRDAVPVFASQAWFEAFEAQINASSEYREAASRLGGRYRVPDHRGAGPRGAGGSVGLPRSVARRVPRRQGDRRRPRPTAAAYTLTAPYSRWKDVVEGELDPIKGMMQGKLRVHGDLPTIVRYVQAANELVRLTGLDRHRVPRRGAECAPSSSEADGVVEVADRPDPAIEEPRRRDRACRRARASAARTCISSTGRRRWTPARSWATRRSGPSRQVGDAASGRCDPATGS